MTPRRYELSDFESSIIEPLLPNKPRWVPRADDRKVLNGIYWRNDLEFLRCDVESSPRRGEALFPGTRRRHCQTGAADLPETGSMPALGGHKSAADAHREGFHMTTISRRSLLATSAAAAVGLGVGRAALAQSDKAATLKLQAFGGEAELRSITNAIARFNKDYPNVKVEVSIDPITDGWGAYVTKVFGQFNSGSAADVYGTAIETFQAFASRGLFLPLDDYVKSHSDFSDFAPSLLEQSSYKGNIYFIPIGWNNIMINYNRDLFDKAGVAYPKQGWTWDEFRETAKALTVKDASGNVTQFGYEVPSQNFFVQPWFLSNGTSPLNADWTASNMLDPKVAESLQFLHDLIHVDGVSPIPGKDVDGQPVLRRAGGDDQPRPLDRAGREARRAQHGRRRRARQGERHDGDRLRRLCRLEDRGGP